jgi:hypothetical protein
LRKKVQFGPYTFQFVFSVPLVFEILISIWNFIFLFFNPGLREIKSLNSDGKKKKTQLTSIDATKIVDLGVNMFYSMREVSLECSSTFPSPKMVALTLENFLFRVDFRFMN